jgi:hypothetical protein
MRVCHREALQTIVDGHTVCICTVCPLPLLLPCLQRRKQNLVERYLAPLGVVFISKMKKVNSLNNLKAPENETKNVVLYGLLMVLSKKS